MGPCDTVDELEAVFILLLCHKAEVVYTNGVCISAQVGGLCVMAELIVFK